jgi:hypothetical protein
MHVTGTRPDGTHPDVEERASPSLPAEEPAPEPNSELPINKELPHLDLTDKPESSGQSLTAPLSLEERVRRLEDVIAAMHIAPPGWTEATAAARVHQEPPSTAIVAAPEQEPAPVPNPAPPRSEFLPRSEPWLFFEIYAELRAILRMFFDPRYQFTWQTRLMTPLLIVGIVLSHWLLGSIAIIGWLLNFVIFPILLYMLIKVLSREATRYRTTSPDLPSALRL